LPGFSLTTRAVAEVLSKDGIVSLHSRCCAGVALSHQAVDHIKTSLPLVQPQLVVGRLGGVGKIDGAPFDVEDAIRRTARDRGENAAGAVGETRAAGVHIRALVVPVWEHGVVVSDPRQANVSEGGVRGRELGIAVRRQIDACVSGTIEGVREGK
jgi:hypothetical protein